jgi:glutamate-1-semialdehyde aminotransferase
VYRSENAIGYLWERGRQLHEGMRNIFSECGVPATVRGLPPCGQLSFTTGDPARNAELMIRFEGEILKRGVMIYEAGSWGPEAADALLAHDGRAWRRP